MIEAYNNLYTDRNWFTCAAKAGLFLILEVFQFWTRNIAIKATGTRPDSSHRVQRSILGAFIRYDTVQD